MTIFDLAMGVLLVSLIVAVAVRIVHGHRAPEWDHLEPRQRDAAPAPDWDAGRHHVPLGSDDRL
jgi:hypothetical protein